VIALLHNTDVLVGSGTGVALLLFVLVLMVATAAPGDRLHWPRFRWLPRAAIALLDAALRVLAALRNQGTHARPRTDRWALRRWAR
jgi:hypothetical protein